MPNLFVVDVRRRVSNKGNPCKEELKRSSILAAGAGGDMGHTEGVGASWRCRDIV
jgi:hypothetical protein